MGLYFRWADIRNLEFLSWLLDLSIRQAKPPLLPMVVQVRVVAAVHAEAVAEDLTHQVDLLADRNHREAHLAALEDPVVQGAVAIAVRANNDRISL